MNKALLIIQYHHERRADINQHLAENKAHILFDHRGSCHLIAEAQSFTPFTLSPSLLIDKPNSDLLPAFFNLLPCKDSNSKLYLKSESLITLMGLYQSLISQQNFKAIEITYSNESNQFYGLLSGIHQEIDTPDGISLKWFPSEENLNILYNL